MSIYIIIGKNFGDEGKGLATDYFASLSQKKENSCLVIRHNGGGQAGHTVDLSKKRFVFHQLGSGSFRNADTYWAETFLPDLYKLSEETEEFFLLHKKMPALYGHPMCRCVLVDDVLVNMSLESSRGENRHGSCGMGINEVVERSKVHDACICLGDLCNMTAQELYLKMLWIRKNYLPERLEKLGLKPQNLGEYGELLKNSNVLFNSADRIKRNSCNIEIKKEQIALNYDDIIFEGAQGLLLDEDYLQFAPHLTSSRTGAENPLKYISGYMPEKSAHFVYVTRSYVTRHGAGPLPYENEWAKQNISPEDKTNLTNDWQGQLRFAPHGSKEEFFEAVRNDLKKCRISPKVSFMVTHLNETDGTICSTNGKIPAEKWFCSPEASGMVNRIYLSYSPYSEDIRFFDIGD